MPAADTQHYFLPLLQRAVALPKAARVLEMGYYDPAAAIWVAAQGAQLVALRPAIDVVRGLEASAEEAHVKGLEVRLATRPKPEEIGTFDIAILLAPFFLGNQPVRDAIAVCAVALKPEGALYLQVHRRHGGDTFLRFVGEAFEKVEFVDMGGGQRRLYRATGPKPAALPAGDAEEAPLHDLTFKGKTLHLRLVAGVFASHDIDQGTRLLLSSLEEAELPERAAIIDLGCGAGPLGLALAAADPRARVVMVDTSQPAVELATENTAHNGLGNVEIYAGDGYAPAAQGPFDLVVSNLPAHRGHQAESTTANRFIAEAPAHLRHDGEAWFVANKALPYELVASRAFREVRVVTTDGRYKVLHCTKPRQGRGEESAARR